MFCLSLRNILSAVGPTSIEVFEWQRQDVLRKRLRNSPKWSDYATKRTPLQLTGLRLALSVAKADFLQQRNFLLPSLGFILQMDQIIDFGSVSNLRLMSGASTILGDVSQSSLAGRIGQGLSLMLAENRGYSFCGHLSSHLSPHAQPPGSNRPKAADFLFEDRANDRMVLESKASFSLRDNECSPVKSMLKSALEQQVNPSMQRLSPSPSKGFAVYSCLRETGNPTPSSLIFVDPPKQKGEHPISLPPDWVRRQNYAGWMHLMGLYDAASRLRLAQDSHEGVGERFAIIKVGDHRIAAPDRNPDRFMGPWFYPEGRLIIGIEVNALEAISKTLKGDAEALLRYLPLSIESVEARRSKSIMSDGTFFGVFKERDYYELLEDGREF